MGERNNFEPGQEFDNEGDNAEEQRQCDFPEGAYIVPPLGVSPANGFLSVIIAGLAENPNLDPTTADFNQIFRDLDPYLPRK